MSQILFSILLFALSASAAPGENIWPNFRGNPRNNGNSLLPARETPGLSAAAPKVVEFSSKGIIWGTPVVDAENNVYVGTSQKLFHKFDASGKLLWTYHIKDLPDSLIDSAAALTRTGKVIVPGGDGFLHALDRKTGKALWTFAAMDADLGQLKTGETVNSFEGNVTTNDGVIYAGCDNGYVYAIDDSGRKLWSFRTGMMVWSSPAFSPDGSWMAIGSLDRHLYLLDPKTGQLLAKIETAGDVKSSPATDGHTIFFGTSAEKVIAISVEKNATGYSLKEKWSRGTEGEVYSSPAVKDGAVFIGTLRGLMYRFSAETGELQWTYKTHSPVASSPTISADGILFFGAKNSKLYAIEAVSGERVWSFQTSQSLYKTNLDSSPTLFENAKNSTAVALGSYGGKVFFIPTSYCAKNPKDARCASGGNEDKLDYESEIGADAASIRYIDREGRLLSGARENLGLFEPVQLRLIAFEGGKLLDNAAISNFHLKVTILPEVEIRSVVSSDGTILNILPLHGFMPGTKYKVSVSSKYYRNTHWVWNRLKWLGLKKFAGEIEFQTGPETPLSAPPAGLAEKFKLWGMYSMYLTQPQALDTYIPAALDGQAFLVSGFGFQKANGRYLMLAQPALPARPSPIPLAEPSKSFVMEVSQRGSHFMASGSMAIAAMGGAMKFDEAKLSGIFSPGGVIQRGEFFVDSSCLSIKGNGGDYQFPMSLVSWICDHRLHVIGLGSLEGNELIVPQRSGVKALLNLHTEPMQVELDNSAGALSQDVPHLLNLIQYDPESVKVLRFAAEQVASDCWSKEKKCSVPLKLDGKKFAAEKSLTQVYLDQSPLF